MRRLFYTATVTLLAWASHGRSGDDRRLCPRGGQGFVGQATLETIVYDAETTHGGSGGPVLGLDGAVVAVNAAGLEQFGGSNLGVSAAEARRLLPSSPP